MLQSLLVSAESAPNSSSSSTIGSRPRSAAVISAVEPSRFLCDPPSHPRRAASSASSSSPAAAAPDRSVVPFGSWSWFGSAPRAIRAGTSSARPSRDRARQPPPAPLDRDSTFRRPARRRGSRVGAVARAYPGWESPNPRPSHPRGDRRRTWRPPPRSGGRRPGTGRRRCVARRGPFRRRTVQNGVDRGVADYAG